MLKFLRFLFYFTIVYTIVLIGIVFVIQMVKPRASISIDDGNVAIYYRNVNVNDVYKYVGKETK